MVYTFAAAGRPTNGPRSFAAPAIAKTVMNASALTHSARTEPNGCPHEGPESAGTAALAPCRDSPRACQTPARRGPPASGTARPLRRPARASSAASRANPRCTTTRWPAPGSGSPARRTGTSRSTIARTDGLNDAGERAPRRANRRSGDDTADVHPDVLQARKPRWKGDQAAEQPRADQRFEHIGDVADGRVPGWQPVPQALRSPAARNTPAGTATTGDAA